MSKFRSAIVAMTASSLVTRSACSCAAYCCSFSCFTAAAFMVFSSDTRSACSEGCDAEKRRNSSSSFSACTSVAVGARLVRRRRCCSAISLRMSSSWPSRYFSRMLMRICVSDTVLLRLPSLPSSSRSDVSRANNACAAASFGFTSRSCACRTRSASPSAAVHASRSSSAARMACSSSSLRRALSLVKAWSAVRTSTAVGHVGERRDSTTGAHTRARCTATAPIARQNTHTHTHNTALAPH